MAESAVLLVDEVLPHEPIRQWVLSFPFQLRFLFASRPELMGKALGIVHRAIASHLVNKGSEDSKNGKSQFSHVYSAVWTVRCPGALNLNPHAARSISKCCYLMGFMQKTNTVRQYFNGQMRRLRKH
jgi:hypothetical protein